MVNPRSLVLLSRAISECVSPNFHKCATNSTSEFGPADIANQSRTRSMSCSIASIPERAAEDIRREREPGMHRAV